MASNRAPLNGTKTHPLTDHAIGELRRLADEGPIPCVGFNAGTIDRLTREDLVEIVPLRSPYKVHKGGTCAHLRITDAGRQRILFITGAHDDAG